MEKKLKVVTTLFQSNARQIPVMMRKLADEVENPPVKGVTINQALMLIRDSVTGQLNIYGWGDINIDNSISMLTQAQQQLGFIAFRGSLWNIPTGGSAPPKDPA